ncbi:hypothetical protein E2C01_096644 [Portunus trituberculatus]|uniref:Uncharacterized protein n=1 Tax=Portunus trituberculatus TaxID=210409 RepID=A0A5B7K2A3_PORTR|nr:hypothetical protein [Portunus trituberculatus]
MHSSSNSSSSSTSSSSRSSRSSRSSSSSSSSNNNIIPSHHWTAFPVPLPMAAGHTNTLFTSQHHHTLASPPLPRHTAAVCWLLSTR